MPKKVALRRPDAARGCQALQLATTRYWGEQGDRTAAIGDLEALPCLHLSQPHARVLPQIANTDAPHGATA